jgi:hypothetical protein
MVGSKTCARRFPSALARYIATSALRRTSSTAAPGRTALTPALHPTMTSVPWIWNGSSSEVMIRWAMASASATVEPEIGSRANSSPPKRATMSPGPQLFDDPLGDPDQELVASGMAPVCR